MGACDASLLGVPFTINHYTDLHAFIIKDIPYLHTCMICHIKYILHQGSAIHTIPLGRAEPFACG